MQRAREQIAKIGSAERKHIMTLPSTSRLRHVQIRLKLGTMSNSSEWLSSSVKYRAEPSTFEGACRAPPLESASWAGPCARSPECKKKLAGFDMIHILHIHCRLLHLRGLSRPRRLSTYLGSSDFRRAGATLRVFLSSFLPLTRP